MKPEINELIEVSKYYGNNKEFVIAGGGNSSFKEEQTIWIKASGQSLADMSEESLVTLSREKLRVISSAVYSDDPSAREEQVKTDMFLSIIDPCMRLYNTGLLFTSIPLLLTVYCAAGTQRV